MATAGRALAGGVRARVRHLRRRRRRTHEHGRRLRAVRAFLESDSAAPAAAASAAAGLVFAPLAPRDALCGGAGGLDAARRELERVLLVAGGGGGVNGGGRRGGGGGGGGDNDGDVDKRRWWSGSQEALIPFTCATVLALQLLGGVLMLLSALLERCCEADAAAIAGAGASASCAKPAAPAAPAAEPATGNRLLVAAHFRRRNRADAPDIAVAPPPLPAAWRETHGAAAGAEAAQHAASTVPLRCSLLPEVFLCASSDLVA